MNLGPYDTPNKASYQKNPNPLYTTQEKKSMGSQDLKVGKKLWTESGYEGSKEVQSSFQSGVP